MTENRKESIRNQVDFYFSDSNVVFDKWLKDQLRSSNDNSMDISLLLRFPRIKALDTTIEEITESIADSEIVQVSEDKTRISRKNGVIPAPDVIFRRSIRVKPVPATSTIESLKVHFAQYGNVLSVRARIRNEIADACFVEFESEELANSVLEQTVTFPDFDEEVKLESRVVYMQRKREEKKQRREAKRASKQQKTKKYKNTDKEAEFDNPNNVEVEVVLGLLVRASNLRPGISRSTLNTVPKSYGDVRFVDFTAENNSVIYRFSQYDLDAPKRMLSDITDEHKSDLSDDLVLEILEGEEEINYWKKILIRARKRKVQEEGEKSQKTEE
ncbi:hypothetical protein PCE1_001935 [Barthelona sp. PCE]